MEDKDDPTAEAEVEVFVFKTNQIHWGTCLIYTWYQVAGYIPKLSQL